jgi:hypothetical protein
MQQLPQVTHAQWAYRNAMVYLELKDGRTAAAHERILETIEDFLHTDLEQLLEEHHHLLFSEFAALVSGPTKETLEWISEIDSALDAASPDGVQVGHGGCRGEYEITETSQTVVTASVHPWQPLSLIQDGADGVSPAQGSGLCSTLVDEKGKHICSLLV